MLSRPLFFPNTAPATVAYRWTNDLSDAVLFPTDHEHPRLMQAMASLNFRGQLLALAGVLEWVYWRLEPLGAPTDLNLRIESIYAALASPAYSNLDERPLPALPDEVDMEVRGPVLMACRLLAEGFRHYWEISPRIGDCAGRAVLLARTVSPPLLQPFDDWLEWLLRRIAQGFAADSVPPAEVPRIGRYFILNDEPLDAQRNEREIDAFLRGLDWHANQYLNSPEAMQKLGFAGNTYRFPP